MKNSFLTLAFVALATICNSNLFAKVLPVNEEFESLEIFILENFEMNEIPELSVGIQTGGILSSSYCFLKKYKVSSKYITNRTFLPATSLVEPFDRIEGFHLP